MKSMPRMHGNSEAWMRVVEALVLLSQSLAKAGGVSNVPNEHATNTCVKGWHSNDRRFTAEDV